MNGPFKNRSTGPELNDLNGEKEVFPMNGGEKQVSGDEMGEMGRIRGVFRQWRQWLPMIPVGLILWAGWKKVTLWTYLDLLALLFVVVLGCNPFGLVSSWLSPASRGGLSVSVIMVMCALQFPELDPYCRCCLISVAAAIAIITVLLMRPSLYRWQVKQSPQVDKVLSNLSHGGELDAVDAWDHYGCRETRALLHQAMGIECHEQLLCGEVRAAYILGFLHGGAGMEAKANKLQQQLKNEEKISQSQMERLWDLKDQRVKIAELEKQLADAEKQNEKLRQDYKRLKTHAEEAYAILDAQAAADAAKDRDTIILEMVKNGKSYAAIAAEVGVSKATVSNVVNRNK